MCVKRDVERGEGYLKCRRFGLFATVLAKVKICENLDVN